MRAHELLPLYPEESPIQARGYVTPPPSRCVHVVQLLRDVQSAVTPDRGVTVTLEVDESLYIAADALPLRRALVTLLSDAIVHSRAGHQVFMRCRADDAGVAIEIEGECGGVTDAGAPPSHLSAAAIIETMGGEMSIERRAGRGCTYSLLFALARPTTWPPPTTDQVAEED